jgi:hypothetical protein
MAHERWVKNSAGEWIEVDSARLRQEARLIDEARSVTVSSGAAHIIVEQLNRIEIEEVIRTFELDKRVTRSQAENAICGIVNSLGEEIQRKYQTRVVMGAFLSLFFLTGLLFLIPNLLKMMNRPDFRGDSNYWEAASRAGEVW